MPGIFFGSCAGKLRSVWFVLEQNGGRDGVRDFGRLLSAAACSRTEVRGIGKPAARRHRIADRAQSCKGLIGWAPMLQKHPADRRELCRDNRDCQRQWWAKPFLKMNPPPITVDSTQAARRARDLISGGGKREPVGESYPKDRITVFRPLMRVL